jgi:hypothetical protein
LTFAGSSRAGTANIVASISFACLNMDADSTVGDGVDAVEVLAVAVEGCFGRGDQGGDGNDDERLSAHGGQNLKAGMRQN